MIVTVLKEEEFKIYVFKVPDFRSFIFTDMILSTVIFYLTETLFHSEFLALIAGMSTLEMMKRSKYVETLLKK